jgi:hypothetical protein
MEYGLVYRKKVCSGLKEINGLNNLMSIVLKKTLAHCLEIDYVTLFYGYLQVPLAEA